ncbi:MAG TPA: TIGR03000 domain-containing protein [Gemmataceae bacterium]|nr:TIGR03000 domain-containing protein [Gemmataceae bacterium]
MNRRFAIGGRIVLALSAAVFLAGSAAGQSDGSSYPYWATAPGGYRGTSVTVPVPGPSSSTISNAARSTPFSPASMYLGSGIGGVFLPPFLTAKDTGSRLPGSDQENRAHIWLRVPDNAEVWVDGVKTRQSGELRHFFSPPLKPGQQYAYNMRIRWMENGKPVEKTQRIFVSAGVTVRRHVIAAGGMTRK